LRVEGWGLRVQGSGLGVWSLPSEDLTDALVAHAHAKDTKLRAQLFTHLRPRVPPTDAAWQMQTFLVLETATWDEYSGFQASVSI
jgi:hypothetical protein